MSPMHKVSFDFDGTLATPEVQEYALELINQGIEVWIVTARYDENHKHRYLPNPTLEDLWEVADRLVIPRDRVRFMNMVPKHEYLHHSKFLWHLDDCDIEHENAIVAKCAVPYIHVHDPLWKEKCDWYLKHKS